MVYAGFWKRFAAAWIDYLVTHVVSTIFAILYVFLYLLPIAESSGTQALIDTTTDAQILWVVMGQVITWIYYAIFEASNKQGTLGKLAVGIKVTDLHGNRIGLGRASGRYFDKFISATIIFVGYIMVTFTKRKQGLHDMLAGCLVINRYADPSSISDAGDVVG